MADKLKSPDAARLFKAGIRLQRKFAWDRAASKYQQAIDLDGSDARLHYRLGICEHWLGRWDSAASAFEKAVALYQGAPSKYALAWQHRLAFVYRMLSEPKAARRYYSFIANDEPSIMPWLSKNDLRGQKKLAELWALIDGHPKLRNDARAVKFISRREHLWPQLPEKFWHVAYCNLYLRGHVQAAYLASEIGSRVCRATAPRTVDTEQLAIIIAAAHADAGDFASARALVCSALVNHDLSRRSGLTDFASGLAILDGDIDAAHAIWDSQNLSPEDRAFEQVVAGKSIAVVAPGTSDVARGEEIDSFDIVIRTNFRSHETIKKHERNIGRRTDVCYFNGKFEPQNREKIIESLSRDPLQFVVLRFEDGSRHYRDLVPSRVSSIFNAFYRMNSYAIPKIIFDLARFRPRTIKVFNANFFLSSENHYSGYLDYDIDVCRMFMVHDVIRNIRLSRFFYRNGMFSPDAEMASILELSEELLFGRMAEKVRRAFPQRKIG